MPFAVVHVHNGRQRNLAANLQGPGKMQAVDGKMFLCMCTSEVAASGLAYAAGMAQASASGSMAACSA